MDVFQNIFMHSETFKISPDYALSKCYRTDPKTLIISHAMGLALKESKPRLGWLDKKDGRHVAIHMKKIMELHQFHVNL